MKKLLLSFLSVAAIFSLAACNDKNEVSNEVKNALVEQIIEASNGLLNEQYDDLDGYLGGYTDSDEAYGEYLARNYLVPGVLNHFVDALVKANFTTKQFEVVTEAISDTLAFDFENNTPTDLQLMFIEIFFDLNVEGDQIINGFFYTVTGFDDVVNDSINSVPEKAEAAYKDMHEVISTSAEAMLTKYAVLFNLSDADRENSLKIGKVTLNPVLSYLNSIESSFNTLKDLTDLTQANLTTILKSERDAFKASFGGLTVNDFKNAFNAVNALNKNILGETEDVLDADTINLYSTTIVEVIDTVEGMLDVVCKDVYQAELYNILTNSDNLDNSEKGKFVSRVLIADLVVAVESNLSEATVELIEFAAEIDTTEVFATAKQVAAIGANADYDTLTTEQLASIDAFCIAFSEFM